MVFLVPYDGSDLSRAALDRATEFADRAGTDVLVLTVVPDDEAYARERGWVDEGTGEAFDPESVAARFEAEVAKRAPDASFRWVVPADVSQRASTTIDVVRTIRQVAHEVDADVVVIGSENAGRVSSPVTSVGSPVSEDPQYDVLIVRHA